jgi:hypothetical protein
MGEIGSRVICPRCEKPLGKTATHNCSGDNWRLITLDPEVSDERKILTGQPYASEDDK